MTEILCHNRNNRVTRITVMTKKRVSKQAKQVLENEYKKNPTWSKQLVNQLAAKLDLDRTKVYKWNWDRKKKEVNGV